MIVVANVAEVIWLTRGLYGNASAENLSFRLFQNNVTPAETDTAATYTVASFTGYSNQTLTSSQSSSTWATPTTTGGVTSSVYGASPITWTATSDQSVYGIYVLFATSGILAFAEGFGGAKSLTGANSDQIIVTPKMQLD